MGFLNKLMKTAEDMARQVTPTEYSGNAENFHVEKKKYFASPKI